MNEPTLQLDTRPDVEAFVAEVRRRLADLPAEDRDDLTDGLAADLSDLVAEQGPGVLADPAAYAAELRAAAGLEARGPVDRRGVGEAVTGLLDSSRDRAVGFGERVAPLWDLVLVMRPVWWVARAWVAVQLLDLFFGGWPHTPIPSVGGGPVVGALILLAALVGSVQLGRGRLWPGSAKDRSPAARLVLLVLNAFAIVMAPIVLGQFPAAGAYYDTASYEPSVPGLTQDDQPVRNIYAYDRAGKPLSGVQLFDQDGKPISVNWQTVHDWTGGTKVYPWYAAGGREGELFNVFPLAERNETENWGEPGRNAWSEARPPQFLPPPLVVVPPVTVPPLEKAEAAAKAKAVAEAKAERVAKAKRAAERRTRASAR